MSRRRLPSVRRPRLWRARPTTSANVSESGDGRWRAASLMGHGAIGGAVPIGSAEPARPRYPSRISLLMGRPVHGIRVHDIRLA